ncbi:putative family 17 glucosidase SCW4 [Termitomyces sp. T112]|nr:putative family 17 glucosidase SCW4 [Termitomyces sp. T112]
MNSVLLSVLAVILTRVLALNHFSGITVSNGVGGTSTYTCRTQAQWNELAHVVKNSGFRSLRIIGFDCDALNMASTAAEQAGLTILAGIYIPGSVHANMATTDNYLRTFRDAYHRYGPSRFVGLTIGNEVADLPVAIISEVHRAKSLLKSVGVTTPISTAHSWVQYINNPILCGGDFVAANAHAFYDGHIAAQNAGNFVKETVIPALRLACPGKKITITESGWPSRGPADGTGSASPSAERTALVNLNCASKNDPHVFVYAFEYDDQMWKSKENERSFGIFGKFSLGNDVLAAC